MTGDTGPLTSAQKEYLEGFAAGLRARGLVPFVGERADGTLTHLADEASANLAAPDAATETAFGVPIDELTREERLKLEENPLDIWDKILRHAAADKPPEGGDVFRFKFHGLFYVAPAQDAFMLRVRVPGNALTAVQMHALGRIARQWGGGYGDVTTRGNIQIRDFAPRDVVNVLMALADAGLSSRGAGADNVRNITATPTSGLDRDELYDVRPLAKGLQFYLNNNRDLFGLPRKFNVAFDSGGSVSVVSDTNDIAFLAVQVPDGKGIEPGIYFRVMLAGITGHGFFAEDAGIVVAPEECVAVAAAMIRVFADQGDRTDRKKARLRFLIERVGIGGFLAAVQKKLGFPLRHLKEEDCRPRRPVIRHGHVGVYAQKQPGLNYVGVAVPVGRLSAAQMDGLAAIAEECGSGELRLTVWQSVILPDVSDARLPLVERRVRGLGLHIRAASVTAGLVACTGNTGCKFAATNTKGHAVEIGRYLERHVVLDRPINIHLTGCPNSCAQHYVADIGLLGVAVPQGAGSIEGYHICVGGGTDHERGLGREIARNVPVPKVPKVLAALLDTYLAERASGESFLNFARRHDVDALQRMVGATVG